MTPHLSFTPHLCGSRPGLSRHPDPTFSTIFGLFPEKPAVLNGSWVEKCATFSRHRSSSGRGCRTHKAPAPYPGSPNPEHALAASKQSSRRPLHFHPVFTLKIHLGPRPAAAKKISSSSGNLTRHPKWRLNVDG